MTTDKNNLIIIGIGSSAGGLEAIRELVATLPTTLNVAYVVVQHMSPHHKSLMTELVARQTSLEVMDVKDGTTPKPSVIYVTPPTPTLSTVMASSTCWNPVPRPPRPNRQLTAFCSALRMNMARTRWQ